MIYVHDAGRMANNMLQYGHLYAWGREHGRATMSMRFAYKYPYFHICHTPHHHFLTYVLAKYAAKWQLIPTVRFDRPDADYKAEEQLLLSRRHVVVTGWYARWYELFLKYRADIVRLFAFDEAVERAAAARWQGGRDCIRIGVHVRRGDYARWNGGRYYYSDEQYAHAIESAIALLQSDGAAWLGHDAADRMVKGVRIYVCGNDPSLDRAYYERRFGTSRISFPDGNPGEDLCLFSHCDLLLGPPSTFTLAASMYRDLPLCWITAPEAPLAATSFQRFATLFRQIQ